ncbi:MAG: SDR family NAD(P)-dependent oxidoreductase, partial [Spirulinaceae cyanobacterium RM2_2_10]|nr:SDR family NAD(P)-dependent oxidoreductase [Spirulinaceae cyanobacterium RM2_2_10]
DPENRSSIISTDDLARITADSARNEAARQQVLAVGGPEIIQRGDIPKIFSRIYQREPFVVNIPLPLFDGARGLLGAFNPDAERDLGTLRTLLANEFFCTSEQVAQVEAIYGLKLESLEQFLRRYSG